jgi:hypothetical protein
MATFDVMLEPVRVALSQIGAFLPRVLLAFVIVVAGWVLARLVRFALMKALRAMNFHVVTDRAGIDGFLKQGGGDVDTIRVLGTLVYWLMIVAALMIASNSLALAYVTELLGRIVLFVPRVIVAVVVLVFGAYFARFVGTAVTRHLANAQVRDATLFGRIAHYAVLVFVALIALDQLGLGDIIRLTFLIVIAAVAFGLALAFGLGGQRRAGELIERWTRGARPPEEPPASPRRPVL